MDKQPQLGVGAVLKKVKILGFGGPGLKIHVLKNIVAPLLSSKEKAVSYLQYFWRTGILKFWGNMAGLGLFYQKSTPALARRG